MIKMLLFHSKKKMFKRCAFQGSLIYYCHCYYCCGILLFLQPTETLKYGNTFNYRYRMSCLVQTDFTVAIQHSYIHTPCLYSNISVCQISPDSCHGSGCFRRCSYWCFTLCSCHKMTLLIQF